MGEAPDPELVVQIESLVLSHKDIMGVHDLVVHDYGPGRLMITLHAEVPANADMIATHDVIDNIECDLSDQLGCHAVIHMDPVETDNIAVMSAREQVALLVCELDPALSIHDFRMVSGPTHVNIIFDVVSPFSFRLTDEQLKSQLREMIKKAYPTYKPIITVDKKLHAIKINVFAGRPRRIAAVFAYFYIFHRIPISNVYFVSGITIF